MKYMIMMFGTAEEMVATRTPEWIQEMFKFMHSFYEELNAAGELVLAEGLVDSTQAKTIRVIDGLPVPTDGPYAETKESLAGFWIVDVESEERALALATRVAAFIEGAVEVRRVGNAPPDS